MTKAAFIVVQTGAGRVLAPVDDDGREIVGALALTKPVMVHVHAARNPGHHRMLFAVFKVLTDAGVWDADMDALLEWMKYATHLVRNSIDHNDKIHTIPKSIAFESMPQDQFRRWFDRVIYVICQRLLKTDDWQALRDSILEIVEGDLKQRYNEANPHAPYHR
jgi:hypothetical protein